MMGENAFALVSYMGENSYIAAQVQNFTYYFVAYNSLYNKIACGLGVVQKLSLGYKSVCIIF